MSANPRSGIDVATVKSPMMMKTVRPITSAIKPSPTGSPKPYLRDRVLKIEPAIAPEMPPPQRRMPIVPSFTTPVSPRGVHTNTPRYDSATRNVVTSINKTTGFLSSPIK